MSGILRRPGDFLRQGLMRPRHRPNLRLWKIWVVRWPVWVRMPSLTTLYSLKFQCTGLLSKELQIPPMPPAHRLLTTLPLTGDWPVQHQWQNNYFAVGTFGIAPKLYAQGVSGLMSKFQDIAFDAQYEHYFPIGALTLHSSLIKETETRDITKSVSTKLDFKSLKADANFYLKNGLGATLGYFYTQGSVDDNVGSWTDKPDSNGFIGQIEYLPWYNTKFAVQYVAYSKFDGTIWNYDNHERNAADNNTPLPGCMA